MRPSAELRGALSRLGLDGHAELLAPYATIEIGLFHDEDGHSRIGGAPELPPDFRWPCRRWPIAEIDSWPELARSQVDVSRGLGQIWAEGDDLVMPLAFLAQIDLESIEPHDRRLPDRGVLSFFASITSDIEDPAFAKRVAAHVAYFDEVTALRRRPHPPTIDEPPGNLVKLRAERTIRWTIPGEELPRLEAALPPAAFASLAADMQREPHALFPAPAEECVGPMPPFGDVALLRLHADPVADFYVGDATWLTFSISELDLRARRFEAARAGIFIG